MTTSFQQGLSKAGTHRTVAWKTIAARKHREDLLQAPIRKQASSPAGSWILVMKLVGESRLVEARTKTIA